MRKNKWKDIRTCMKLIKYGMSAKQSVGTMILFIVIGVTFEMMWVLGFYEGVFRNTTLDFGALFLYSAAMYPAQILMTLDISGMVQASPFKRTIQNSAASFACLCGNLAVFAIVLLIRLAGAHILPERAAVIWDTLPAVGVMGLALSVMGALLYKFYIVSIIALAVIFGVYGGFISISRMGASNGSAFPLPASIVLCIVMILLGNGLQYLLTGLFYKRPFSKGAFGNAAGKKFV
ncbi:MAG: hypothetical protein K2O97_13665 [Acetatifactor sp.]|jgi:hypothetical protein|nr:hypothetical protein [Acetatifactor sp.]MDE7046024.1 hypothetical protein [Acetatifactor sp.]